MLPQTILLIGTLSTFVVSKVIAKVFRVRTMAAFWFCISILSVMMIITGSMHKDKIVPSTDKTYWSTDFSDYNTWVIATWGQYASVDHRVADSSSEFWKWVSWLYLAASLIYIVSFGFYIAGNNRLVGLALFLQFVVSCVYFWPIADQIGFSAIAVMWIVFPLLALSALDVFHLPTFGGVKKSKYTCYDDGHCGEDSNGKFATQGDCLKGCKQK